LQPLIQEPPEPVRAEEPGQEQFSTETLADLYAQQGLTDKAVGMYRQILQEDPDNEAVKLKMKALGFSAFKEQDSGPDVISTDPTRAGTSPTIDSEQALNALEAMLDNVERIKKT